MADGHLGEQKTERLIAVLAEITELLNSEGERNWVYWAATAQSFLRQGDYAGISYILTANGGMGSINDLVLGSEFKEGIYLWKAGSRELNGIHELLAQAWELATEMKVSGSLL